MEVLFFVPEWSDIGYNFIVGEDGNVYEGRGWGIRGAHAGTSSLNEISLGKLLTISWINV